MSLDVASYYATSEGSICLLLFRMFGLFRRFIQVGLFLRPPSNEREEAKEEKELKEGKGGS